MIDPRLAALVVLLLLAVGCDYGAKAATAPHDKPAKTTYPVSESQLNTIELTSDAVRRLALTTAKVEERSMTRSRSYGADIVLPTGASVIVSAPLAGTLQVASSDDLFQVGRSVKEGQTLLKLLPMLSPERSVLTPAERIRFAEAKNALAQSRIDADGLVQQAQVQVDAAKIALERAERLLRDKAGTVRAVDDAKAQLLLAEKTHAAAATRKKLVDNVSLEEDPGKLESVEIRSPLAGVIRATQVRPGEIVAAGAPLFEVMNEDLLWIKVPVYVGELDEVDQTRPARITSLDGRHTDKDLFVKPVALPPTAVPLAAAVDLYYELRGGKRSFRPGQKVAAHLTLKVSTKQIAVPWAAVIHDVHGGQWVYEQTGSQTFVRRRIDVAWVDGNWAAIRRGPKPGTKVVTAGAAEIAGAEFGFAK